MSNPVPPACLNVASQTMTSATSSIGICSFFAISIGIVPSRRARKTLARTLAIDFPVGIALAKRFKRVMQVFGAREFSGVDDGVNWHPGHVRPSR